MLSHYTSGTQRLWIINPSTLTMVKSLTYNSASFTNPTSVFQVVGTSLFTLFTSASNKESIVAVDTSTFMPTDYIIFIPDVTQLTVTASDSVISISTSASLTFSTTSLSNSTATITSYTNVTNVLTTTPFTGVVTAYPSTTPAILVFTY